MGVEPWTASWARCGDTCLQSQHLEIRTGWAELRPTWTISWVPGQLGLHSDSNEQTKDKSQHSLHLVAHIIIFIHSSGMYLFYLPFLLHWTPGRPLQHCLQANLTQSLMIQQVPIKYLLHEWTNGRIKVDKRGNTGIRRKCLREWERRAARPPGESLIRRRGGWELASFHSLPASGTPGFSFFH